MKKLLVVLAVFVCAIALAYEVTHTSAIQSPPAGTPATVEQVNDAKPAVTDSTLAPSTSKGSVRIAASQKYMLPIRPTWRTEEVTYKGGSIDEKDILIYDEQGRLVMKVTQPLREIGYEGMLSTAQSNIGTGIGALTKVLRTDDDKRSSGMMHYLWDGGKDFWNDSFEIFVYFGDWSYYKSQEDEQAGRAIPLAYRSVSDIQSSGAFQTPVEDMIGGIHAASDVNTSVQPDITVEGMSRYTDKAFGFSFWYPSGWSVTAHANAAANSYPNGSYDGVITIRSNGNPNHVMTIQKVTANDLTYRVTPGACGYCGPLNYFFDKDNHIWVKEYPQGPNGAPDMPPDQVAAYKIPKPADVSHNTMGGLHMFGTEQRESAVIIPLSARHFILVTDNTYTEMCGGACGEGGPKGGAGFLAETVLATDPSVGTPVSVSGQEKIIQAERAAYEGL